MKDILKIKTKVVHSESKPAWNIICTDLGRKFKIAQIPYLIIEGSEKQTTKEKYEALVHAEFISKCFNNSDKIIDKIF